MDNLSNFFEENEQALRKPNIVLRDSLGSLAVQILASRPNFSSMSNRQLLCELHQIICDLHEEYDRAQGNFNF